MLIMRRQIFSACSACVDNFLAHTQHAQKTQNANICRSLQKYFFFLQSSSHLPMQDLKKWVENLAPLKEVPRQIFFTLVGCRTQIMIFYFMFVLRWGQAVIVTTVSSPALLTQAKNYPRCRCYHAVMNYRRCHCYRR